MDHQTYKSWILNDELLSGEDLTQLEEHLAECIECARLKTNLDTALRMVRLAPPVPAPPNFTQHFTTSLAARKREEEKHQARSLTLALSSSAMVVAFGALLIFLPDISLISLTAGLISSMLRVFELAQSTASFVSGFVNNANPSSLVTLFVVIGGWIVLASLTLALSVWKLAIKKVGTNR
jgi:anti-sigma factor RsiW